jgi:hypothetical protein
MEGEEDEEDDTHSAEYEDMQTMVLHRSMGMGDHAGDVMG